jgi:hypothetical protein
MIAEKGSSLFWLIVSIIFLIGAAGLGIGDVRMPGAGFTSFGAAVLLGLLSMINFTRAAARGRMGKTEPLFRGTFWLRVVLVFISLFAYAQILPLLGYNIATFLLMVLLFWIAGRQKLWKVIAYALMTTVMTYYIFSKWLNCQFPLGPFGF